MAIIEGFDIPEDLHYYVEKHVWVKVEEDGNVRMGLTDTGQHLAKKILFIRVKPPGVSTVYDKPIGTMESAKWVGPIAAPLNGVILEANPALRSKPTLVNEKPYAEGWIARITPANLEEDLAKLVTGEKALEDFKAEILARGIKKE